MQASPPALIEQLHDAMNRHDLESFLACFDANYQSEQPAHPNRAFVGREQVRKNWGAIFTAVPDLRVDLLRTAEEGDTIWSEWHWQGRQQDGTALDMRGVILFGMEKGRITWGRLYMEDTEMAGADINAAVRGMTTVQSGDR